MASCGYVAPPAQTKSSPIASTVITFHSDEQRLALPGLRVGDSVYPDVVLFLGKDGSWRIQSVGVPRPITREDVIQAVLTSPANAALSTDWRPNGATITIRRMHIDTKVYGDVPLHLNGDSWAWGGSMHELSALTMKDFKANPSLVATETHHVVLQSRPDIPTQSYPMKLGAKIYTFCMNAQDDGADTLQLIDADGNQVFSLNAGDPCVSIAPDPGVYTMKHTYGGSGTSRVVFIHPIETAPAALASKRSPTRRVFAASDPNHPEYWAVYFVDETGAEDFLTFSGTNDQGGTTDPNGNYTAFGCQGQIQAVAGTTPYWWPQDKTTRTRYLFDAANFFEISVSSDGTPSGFGLPLDCISWPPLDGSGRSVDPAHHTYALDYKSDYNNQPLWIVPMTGSYVSDNNRFVQENLTIASFSNNAFQLNKNQVSPDPVTWPLTVFAGPTRYVGLNYYASPAQFHLGFRYFPEGLPPSMEDSSGAWILAKGEMAMFSGSNCTGAAMISEGVSLPYPQPDVAIAELAILGGFSQSFQLGPDTAAAVYSGSLYKGDSKIFNQSACQSFSAAGFAPESIRVRTDSATIVAETNSCEYCNLEGVDMQDGHLRDVKLQHANLTNAQLSSSNLSNADLRFATLQGAKLNYANLEFADLCQATLNAGASGAAASLSGAHLKNANLSGADLDGADFSYASFYSDAPQSCQSSCDTYAQPTCASAYGASMDGTRFDDAYLAGVDMGSARAEGASFTGAMLFGVSFKNANLNRNAATGNATTFSYAFLQGADFTNAQVRSANFTNAYVESDDNASCIQTDLNNEYTGFPGLLVADASGSCVSGTQNAPTCIQYTYGAAHLPVTDASNSCPNGAAGPCSNSDWTSPVTPLARSNHPNSSCTSNPLCDGFAVPLNTCW